GVLIRNTSLPDTSPAESRASSGTTSCPRSPMVSRQVPFMSRDYNRRTRRPVGLHPIGPKWSGRPENAVSARRDSARHTERQHGGVGEVGDEMGNESENDECDRTDTHGGDERHRDADG